MGKTDYLNREKFVGQLVQLIECMADNGTATSFAVSGTWGCGKSFVLDKLEEQLSLIQSEKTAAEKYFIIRYNCWKYDYYEEPLIAIVAALIAEIDEKTSLFPDGQDKREILGMLKATGVSLLTMLNSAVKEKTGFDFKEAFETVNNGAKEAAKKYEEEHSFDVYFGFNKIMGKLTELLKELSEKYTLVFLVDELDRCPPEYAIKVLERLHHLTEGDTKIITVIAMDKDQLMTSIEHTFGFQKPEKYLEKFIHFEVVLDCGDITDNILEKYPDYVSLFDKDIFRFDESVEVFIREIFMGIDIRTQEQLVKRAMLVHKLLYKEKKDYSFMCMELLIAVMICFYGDISLSSNRPFDVTALEEMFIVDRKDMPPLFAGVVIERIKNIKFRIHQRFKDEPVVYTLPNEANLYGAVVLTWFWLHTINHPKILLQYVKDGVYSSIANNSEALKKFVEMIVFVD